MKERARMIELAGDAILVLNQKNQIIYWNKGAEKMYGYSHAEAKGRIASKLLKTKFPYPLTVILGQVFKSKSWEGELIHTRKDGEVLTVDSHWEMFKRDGDIAFLEVNRDITLRKMLDRQKDEFISIAAHELRTPLTSVKALSQIILYKLNNADINQVKDLLQKQMTGINKLNRLIGDLLDVSKIQAGKLTYNWEEINIDILINDAIESVQTFSNSHKIIKSGRLNEILKVDPDRIEQVLINLLNNAVKYSPGSDKIKVTVKKDDGVVIIGVTDYGIGINENELTNIFKRFYRVNNRIPGLGVGLFISNQIIKNHQGEMWVESNPGRGSTFYFSLPAN
jgi:PAS domain S-box-containing protein